MVRDSIYTLLQKKLRFLERSAFQGFDAQFIFAKDDYDVCDVGSNLLGPV